MRPRRVVYQLRGQLGNQLFESATAVGEGMASGQRPEHFYNAAHGTTTEWLQHIAIPGFPRATRWTSLVSGGWVPLASAPLAARAFFRLVYQPLWRGSRHLVLAGDDLSPFTVDRAYFKRRYRSLEGYFQHPDYFERGLPAVLQVLRETLTLGSGDPAVGVHVRGGDYVELGWALDSSYYLAAAARLPPTVAAHGFRVIGDDRRRMEDVASALTAEGFDADISAMDTSSRSPQETALADLARLASHHHLVMSNSTFCWWAATLGDAVVAEDDRFVVVPSPWAPHTETSLSRSHWLAVGASFA